MKSGASIDSTPKFQPRGGSASQRKGMVSLVPIFRTLWWPFQTLLLKLVQDLVSQLKITEDLEELLFIWGFIC